MCDDSGDVLRVDVGHLRVGLDAVAALLAAAVRLDELEFTEDRQHARADRYNPAGQNVGRYNPDKTPIKHKGKWPAPVPKSDYDKFDKAAEKLKPKPKEEPKKCESKQFEWTTGDEPVGTVFQDAGGVWFVVDRPHHAVPVDSPGAPRTSPFFFPVNPRIPEFAPVRIPFFDPVFVP
jgi:hypothetical protein